jgi:hypothetical protein
MVELHAEKILTSKVTQRLGTDRSAGTYLVSVEQRLPTFYVCDPKVANGM